MERLNPANSQSDVSDLLQLVRRTAPSRSTVTVQHQHTLSDSVKLLGVTLDSTLSFDRHVSEIVRSCYFHIRALKHIRAYLSLNTAISVGVCIVAARLDRCNSLLHGT